ncbi:transposase [Halomonas alkaliantarctica]|nr:transposase [Halomonas alkaliantarctica]
MSVSTEQIIGLLGKAEVGLPINELYRRHGSSEASYYLWRSKLGGMSKPDSKQLNEFQFAKTILKKLYAESLLEMVGHSRGVEKVRSTPRHGAFYDVAWTE